MTSIEDYLNERGSLTYSNVGTSMLPLLRQGRDLFIVRAKVPGECFQVGDVILYKRPPDSYVLHRIVALQVDGYVLLGDNCVNREYGIRDESILGVMTGYVRDGQEHRVTEKQYQDYTARILRQEKPRIAGKKLRMKCRKILKRVVGRE